jgi:hypothetical protein
MTDTASSLRSVPSPEIAPKTVAAADTACPFCLEDIKAGASVCKHCGASLSLVHQLVLARAALEARLAAVEADLAALRAATVDTKAIVAEEPADQSALRRAGWPHMFDNLFLGLAALLVVHWLASTVPHGQKAVYRLVALCVALPFGFRYEIYARASTSAQVVAALFYGVLGALLIITLDAAISGEPANTLALIDGRGLVETVAVIGLSHLTGSWLAWWARREERREAAAAAGLARRRAVSAALAMLLRAEPEKLKHRIDALNGIMEASAPVAAAAATAWAGFGRLLF